ncbi:MAG: PfkB family carbohydrate kinase [candidate division KSB1 bacterium]|nr:PfkB family carbohydrate kinase [candidate division KSB1 bacterium]
MSVVVVGSVALDSVETPAGKVEEALGGSALYFAAAASLLAPVKVVGVVGQDFDHRQIEFLRQRGVDFEGLEVQEGKTFRWGGVYHSNLNERTTLFTHLNVFEGFSPKIPTSYVDSPFLFLANIHPKLQREVLDQMRRPRFVAMDTMNYWITGSPEELRQVLRRVDLLVINDEEARQLTGLYPLAQAASAIQAMGPKAVVIKKGEHGALLFHGKRAFSAPAYPLARVVDPTGAGDTFAGGLMGYLAWKGDTSFETLKQAVMVGTALASFCVEDFSLSGLERITLADVQQRLQDLYELTRFEIDLA